MADKKYTIEQHVQACMDCALGASEPGTDTYYHALSIVYWLNGQHHKNVEVSSMETDRLMGSNIGLDWDKWWDANIRENCAHILEVYKARTQGG